MEPILLLLHTEPDGSLHKNSFEALTAAAALAAESGAPWAIGLVGGEIQSAANAVGGAGAGKILGVSGSEFADSRYASDAAAATALCRAAQATLVIAPSTSRWSRALPGVAQRLDGAIDTHATQIAAAGGQVKVTRWHYRQRIVAELTRARRPWLITVAPGAFAPWTGEPREAAVESVVVEAPASRTKVAGFQAPPADEQTIRPDADLLFVAGAGWTKKQSDGQTHVKEAESIIRGFLNGSKSSLGGSKSLVDISGEGQATLSFMTHLNQIGQTGSTPRHPKGLAACCHGEEPHVVGWRFINERRAINLDPNCGWAQGKADVLYVADAFQVMEKVNEMI